MKLTTIKCFYQLAILIIIGIALVGFCNPAFGKTFTVTNLNDSGKGSLRDNVLQANENPGYDEIEFDNNLADSRIKLISGEIEIKDDLSIKGPYIEPNHLTIDAGRLSRIFRLSDDAIFLALSRLNLTGGYSESGGGGAIYGGTVSLHEVSVVNNEIMNSLSDFTGKLCSGAGIYAHDISLFSSTVSNNKAHDCSGGGLSATKIRLIRSTISGNSANSSGGIHVIDASDEVFILSTTITNNSSIQGAGGLGSDRTIEPLNITIRNSILSGNQGPQGNYFISSEDNSIAAINVSYSIFGDDSSEINGVSKAVIFSNQPDLGPLEENGGPTFTHLPNPTSPALDNGDTRVANTVDQRGTGFKGVVNHRIDIGSVEHQAIQTVSKTQQELNKNLAKWKQFGFDSYEFNSLVSPEFLIANNVPVRYRIQNNIAVKGYYDCSDIENPNTIERCNKSLNNLTTPSVDRLFEFIQTDIDRNNHELIFMAEYHPVYGFPTLYFSDDLGSADDQRTVEYNKFTPLPSTPLSVEHTPLTINHQWKQELVDPDPINSVFFYSAPTNQGPDRGVVRMRRKNGFSELKFQEWSNLDGWHGNETIDLIKLNKGRWAYGDVEIEVNTWDFSGLEMNGHREIWNTIRFSKPFKQPPLVFLALQTTNGAEAVSVRVRKITNTYMEVELMEEDLKRLTGHVKETVGYLLISGLTEPLSTDNGITIKQLEAGLSIHLNHDWKNIAPGKQLRLEEDQTTDAEIVHLHELIHLIDINGIYLSQIVSYKGRDNAVLRSRME